MHITLTELENHVKGRWTGYQFPTLENGSPQETSAHLFSPRANEGSRTPDLCFTRAPLFHLSYVGKSSRRASAMIIRAYHVAFCDFFHDPVPGEIAIHPGDLHHLVSKMVKV